jgi:hypothetical protein
MKKDRVLLLIAMVISLVSGIAIQIDLRLMYREGFVFYQITSHLTRTVDKSIEIYVN